MAGQAVQRTGREPGDDERPEVLHGRHTPHARRPARSCSAAVAAVTGFPATKAQLGSVVRVMSGAATGAPAEIAAAAVVATGPAATSGRQAPAAGGEGPAPADHGPDDAGLGQEDPERRQAGGAHLVGEHPGSRRPPVAGPEEEQPDAVEPRRAPGDPPAATRRRAGLGTLLTGPGETGTRPAPAGRPSAGWSAGTRTSVAVPAAGSPAARRWSMASSLRHSSRRSADSHSMTPSAEEEQAHHAAGHHVGDLVGRLPGPRHTDVAHDHGDHTGGQAGTAPARSHWHRR